MGDPLSPNTPSLGKYPIERQKWLGGLSFTPQVKFIQREDNIIMPNHPEVCRRPWAVVFGLAAVGLYVTLTAVAILRFPGPVSPVNIYLSQLGNAHYSPEGALFYDLGVTLAGLTLIIFFIALYRHFAGWGPNWLRRIALWAGVVNGLAVLMSGVFAEHVDMDAHTAWSYLIFFSLIPLLLVYSLAFWKMAGGLKAISLIGFAVCAVDIFFLATILSGGLDTGLGSIMEWFSVFSYLAWILLVSLDGLVFVKNQF
jgi:hypothetical protein